MNPKELQENIALYYSKLPPNTQETFSSMNWLETLKKISMKYSLSDAQVETLGTETTLVLLGIIHPEEYEETLKNELELADGSLSSMMTEINSSIISSVRPELIEVFHINNQAEEKKLDKRFEKLPKEIQNAIIESNYHAILLKIAEEYKLSVPQMGILEESTTNVMLGIIHPNDFESTLQRNLGIPDEKIKSLVNEVNEKILKNIRVKMMSLENNHLEGEKVYSPGINKDEARVLDSAGITIVDAASNLKPPVSAPKSEAAKYVSPFAPPPLNAMELKAPEILPTSPVTPVTPPVAKVMPAETTHTILMQKLSDSFKIGATSTEYSLSNISKEKIKTENPIPKKTSYPPKADPYRINPEE